MVLDPDNYGDSLTEDGRREEELKTRIAMNKISFRKISTIVINIAINMKIKLGVMKCCVWSVLLYGCQTHKQGEEETN